MEIGRKAFEMDPIFFKVDTATLGRKPQEPTEPYTVIKGDCLWRIAKKRLGKGRSWRLIYQLNPKEIGNPNRIRPGQVFVLPRG